MDAETIVSRRLIKWTDLDQTGPRAANSFSFPSPSLSTHDLPTEPNREIVSRELRSEAEQQFRRMNQDHDRIRTEMLCANDASKK